MASPKAAPATATRRHTAVTHRGSSYAEIDDAGWIGELNQKPFIQLRSVRQIIQEGLPADLADFYSRHEGVGFESSPDRLIRLGLFDEVVRIRSSDLDIFGKEGFPGWEDFSGYRIGISSFFDDIVYVISSPCSSSGSILGFGADIIGPAGSGPFPFECSIVLAGSFSSWLKRLENQRWFEYGLFPGELFRVSRTKQRELRDYYLSLNPNLQWDEFIDEATSKPWWKFW